MCKLIHEYKDRSSEHKKVLVNSDMGIIESTLIARSKSGKYLLVDSGCLYGRNWVRKECVLEDEI